MMLWDAVTAGLSHPNNTVRWPSGLRRQTKVTRDPIWSERAWVRIPLSSLFFVFDSLRDRLN